MIGDIQRPPKGDRLFLRAWREYRGLTQEELARRAFGLNKDGKSRISKYESGTSDPPLSVLLRLASALGIRACFLFWPPKAVFQLEPPAKHPPSDVME